MAKSKQIDTKYGPAVVYGLSNHTTWPECMVIDIQIKILQSLVRKMKKKISPVMDDNDYWANNGVDHCIAIVKDQIKQLKK